MRGIRRGFRRGGGIGRVCSQALDFSITQSMPLDSESCGGVAGVDSLAAMVCAVTGLMVYIVGWP